LNHSSPPFTVRSPAEFPETSQGVRPMHKIFLAVSLMLAIVALPSFVSAQDKPAIVV
jgi:hypothetical protein